MDQPAKPTTDGARTRVGRMARTTGRTPTPERVSRVVDKVAPAVGLAPAQVRVTVAPSNSRPHGRAHPDGITLAGDIDMTDPRTTALLIHELVHLRQHHNRSTTTPDVTAAEAEAAGLANAWRHGSPLWTPRTALPDGHTAHDDGASGVAPTTEPTVPQLEATLDTYVAANHSGDVRAITAPLHDYGTIVDWAIENSLRVLSLLPFVVARALVRALDPTDRRQLAHLTDDHHQRYPDTCMAVLGALNAVDLDALGAAEGSTSTPLARALHGIQTERLSASAHRALLATLRGASATVLAELLHGDRRNVFRTLLSAGPSTDTDAGELKAAIDVERAYSASHPGADDSQLYERVAALLRQGGAANATAALTALEPVAFLPTESRDQGTNAPPVPPAPLIALVMKLETDGLIDTLVDDLPRGTDTTFVPILWLLLSARNPLPNLAKATDLLSYGLFDWAIRDWEARLAYLLVRSTPIAAQDTWRRQDNGKWLSRLEDNLPDDVRAGGNYTGVGSEYTNQAATPIADSAALDVFAVRVIERWQADTTPTMAVALVRELLNLDLFGNDKPAADDLAVRTEVVRRVDARQWLDKIIDALPDDYLFGERGRGELLALHRMRDPVHLVQQAAAPTISRLGWLTFTRRDAWIAALAFLALPAAERKRLSVDNPNLWSTLWQGMTPEMRAAVPNPLAAGGEGMPARADLRERISDQRLWTEDYADELRALLDLAVAAEDKAWVFQTSRLVRIDRRAVGNPKLTALAADFSLYGPTHPTYEPGPASTGSRAPVWGHSLGVIGRALGIAAYDLLIDPSMPSSLIGKTMYLKGFDLRDLETIGGGDIGGIRLAHDDTTANRVDVEVTFEAGFVVNVNLRDLRIAGLNLVLPDSSYRSGAIGFTGLKVTAGFSDSTYHDPAYVALVFDSMSMRDLVVDSALAMSRVTMGHTSVRANTGGTDDPINAIDQQLPSGTLPIPFLAPLVHVIKNIVAAARSGRSISDMLGMLRGFTVSIESFRIDGLSIGAEEQIRSVTLRAVDVGFGRSLTAYLTSTVRAIRDAQARLPATSPRYQALQQRAVQLVARIDHLRPDENRLQELEAKDRLTPGSLSEDERRELRTLTLELRSVVGIGLDIGSVEVGRMSGRLQSSGFGFRGIHGQGQLATRGLPFDMPGYLDDASLIERFREGAPPRQVDDLVQSTEFDLSIEGSTPPTGGPGKPAVVLLATTLPSAQELRNTLGKLPDTPSVAIIRERMTQAIHLLESLEAAQESADKATTPEARADADQAVREASEAARRQLGIAVDSVRFGQIHGRLNPITGKAEFGIDVELTNVGIGTTAVIDRLGGRIGVGLSPGNIALRVDQLATADSADLLGLITPTFELNDVVAEGIHLPVGLIGTAKLGHLGGSLHRTETGFRVPDLSIDFIDIDGVEINVAGTRLSVPDKARIERLQLDAEVWQSNTGDRSIERAVIHSFAVDVLRGDKIFINFDVLAGGSIHDVRARDVEFAHTGDGWQLLKAYGSIGSFSLHAVLLSSLKSGHPGSAVVGTLDKGIAAGTPSITASYALVPNDDPTKPPTTRIGLGLAHIGADIGTPFGSFRTELGAAGTTYTSDAKGENAVAWLNDLRIGAVDLRAGSLRLHGKGPLRVDKITVAASRTPSGNWAVRDIRLTGITAADLNLTDPPMNLHLGDDDRTTSTEPPLRIEHIRLRPTLGQIQVGAASINFAGQVAERLSIAHGHIGLDSLTVDVSRKDHRRIVLRGLNAGATLSGAINATVGISDIPALAIDDDADRIMIEGGDPDDPDGLRIPDVRLSDFGIRFDLGSHTLELTTLPGAGASSRVDLLDVQARVRLDKWKGTGHVAPFKQVVIERLFVPRVVLGDVQVTVDGMHTFTIPASAHPVLYGLGLSAPPGPKNPTGPQPGFTIDLTPSDHSGKIDFTTRGRLDYQWLAVALRTNIQHLLQGGINFTTWKSHIDFLGAQGLRADIGNPNAIVDQLITLGATSYATVTASVGARKVILDSRTGHAYLQRPGVQDLNFAYFKDNKQVALVRVKDIHTDQLDIVARTKDTITARNLDLTNADLELDVAELTRKDPSTLPPPPYAEPETPSRFGTLQLRPLLDQVNGTISASLALPANIPVLGWTDIKIGSPEKPLVVPIKNGKIDLTELEKNLEGIVSGTSLVAGSAPWSDKIPGYGAGWAVDRYAHEPKLWIDGNQLLLGLFVIWQWVPVLAWDLHDFDMDMIDAEDEFPLWSAIFRLGSLPEDPKKTEQEKAKSAEDGERTLAGLELTSVAAELSVRNKGPLALSLYSELVEGDLVFQQNALLALRVLGGLSARDKQLPRTHGEAVPDRLDINLLGLALQSVDLRFKSYELPAPHDAVPTSALQISGVRIDQVTNGKMTFENLFTPQTFSGTITHGHAALVTWYTL